jgi:hypothetical protein
MATSPLLLPCNDMSDYLGLYLIDSNIKYPILMSGLVVDFLCVGYKQFNKIVPCNSNITITRDYVIDVICVRYEVSTVLLPEQS